MRAVVAAEPGPDLRRAVQVREVADPVAGPGEVLIEVTASAMCRTDLQIAAGDLPPHRAPVIPGHQVVGRVVDGPAERIGQRVGLCWLAGSCGACRFCRTGRENLCPQAQFTGYDVDGGWAELVRARADFAVPLPAGPGEAGGLAEPFDRGMTGAAPGGETEHRHPGEGIGQMVGKGRGGHRNIRQLFCRRFAQNTAIPEEEHAADPDAFALKIENQEGRGRLHSGLAGDDLKERTQSARGGSCRPGNQGLDLILCQHHGRVGTREQGGEVEYFEVCERCCHIKTPWTDQ